jgi:transcriptional regulator with XRE-family HTH domain
MTKGKRIKELRIAANMTQEQLGSRFVTDERPDGFGKQTIAAWESDRNDVGSENLAQLCQIFHVTADYLLFGSPLPAAEPAEVPADELARLVTSYVKGNALGRRLLMAAADSADEARAASDKSKSR